MNEDRDDILIDEEDPDVLVPAKELQIPLEEDKWRKKKLKKKEIEEKRNWRKVFFTRNG